MLKLTIFRQRKGRRRPKIIQPALALANFGAQPGFVVINAFLRTKALERSPMPHQAELAMAVSAVIFHNLSGLSRHSRGRRISVSATSVAAFGPLAGLSISLIRAKAKDARGSSRSLYIRRYRCGDSITSMQMASIIALPICDMRRDLRNLGNQRRRFYLAAVMLDADSRPTAPIVASWPSASSDEHETIAPPRGMRPRAEPTDADIATHLLLAVLPSTPTMRAIA